MAVFATRSLARLLSTVIPLIGDSRVRDLRRRLKGRTEESIGAEWELVMLASLSQMGTIEEIPSEHRKTVPDILFRPATNPAAAVVVEVTAISDKGLEERNPGFTFQRMLTDRMIELDLHRLGGTELLTAHTGSQRQLEIGVPRLKEMPAFFTSSEFQAFVASIRQEPNRRHTLNVRAGGLCSTVTFVPGASTSTANFPNYRALSSLLHNPIVNRLFDKDQQFLGSSVQGPCVLVLADNDCDALQSQGARQPRAEQVIDLFLNGQREQRQGPVRLQREVLPRAQMITGVLVLVAKEDRDGSGRTRPRVEAQYIPNRRQAALPKEAVFALEQAVAAFPPIRNLPVNGRTPWRYPKHYGAYEYGIGDKMTRCKLSLGAIQGLLCGTITFDEFKQHHERLVEVMRSASRCGGRISSFEVEHCPDEDDDWVTIRFQEPDPNEAELQRGVRSARRRLGGSPSSSCRKR